MAYDTASAAEAERRRAAWVRRAPGPRRDGSGAFGDRAM